MKTPRILFIQTPRIWLSLLCTSAMLLAGCGGAGGGAGSVAGTNNTTPTRITVIDGYLQGAVVCVDKNNNGACDPGETQGSTDANGRVVLNIPKADVGQYPIVAAVPAWAVDSDQPGKTVGKAYTLKAPKDSPNNVTPLTTLVQHMVESDSSSTDEATTFVVNQTGVQQPLDDFINRGDSQTRTLARTLAALLQDRLNALSDNSVNSTLSPAEASRVTTSEKHKAVVKALWNAMADIKSRSQLAANSACANAPQSDACQTAINQVVSASLSANSELSTSQLLSSLQTEVAAPSYSSQSNNLMAAAVNDTPQAPGFGNPGVGVPIEFSVRNVPVGTQSVTWNFGEGATPDTTKTLNVTNNSLEKATASYSTPGKKTVTVTFKSINNAVIATDTLNITIGNDNSLPTVRITGVVSNNQYIASGNKTDSNTVLVRGSYRGTLGTGYSIKVFDDTTYLGDARVNPKNNTWTYSATNLSLSSHSFKAAVVSTSSPSDKGTDSNVYSISAAGNNFAASPSSPNVFDSITLTLSKVWATVKKVVFSVVNSADLADPTANLTATKNNDGLWDSISMAFKTSGLKTITAQFFDNDSGTGTPVDTSTVQVNVGSANVTQTAKITDVKDGATSIDDNGSTRNTKPVISGSISTPLNKFYELKLYDNGKLLTDANTPTYTPDGNGNKTAWSFTPANAFSLGKHAITAKVVRIDGVEVAASTARSFMVISKYSQVAKAGGGFYDITECVKDNTTGFIWEGKPAPNSGVKRGGLDPNAAFSNIAKNEDWGILLDTGTYKDKDISGYLNAVNSGAGLCGFKDWRLPIREELLGIVDLTVKSGPKVDAYWFPNNQSDEYWTSSLPIDGEPSMYFIVNFFDPLNPSRDTQRKDFYYGNGGITTIYVRLVR